VLLTGALTWCRDVTEAYKVGENQLAAPTHKLAERITYAHVYALYDNVPAAAF
jgi:hypothetical protein